jgi:hypothetical protein
VDDDGAPKARNLGRVHSEILLAAPGATADHQIRNLMLYPAQSNGLTFVGGTAEPKPKNVR